MFVVFLQVQGEVMVVVQVGQFIGMYQFVGVGQLVGGDVEVVQCGFQIVVVLVQLVDQGLFVGQYVYDCVVQEVGYQIWIGFDQLVEISWFQFQYIVVDQCVCVGVVQVVVDQQVQFFEEFMLFECFDYQVFVEVQFDLVFEDYIYVFVVVVMLEQLLFGMEFVCVGEFGE